MLIEKVKYDCLDKSMVKRFCYEYYNYRYNFVKHNLSNQEYKNKVIKEYNSRLYQLNYGFISIREFMLCLSNMICDINTSNT